MPVLQLPDQFLTFQKQQQHDSGPEDHFCFPLCQARRSGRECLGRTENDNNTCLGVEHLRVPFVPESSSMQIHDHPVKLLFQGKVLSRKMLGICKTFSYTSLIGNPENMLRTIVLPV